MTPKETYIYDREGMDPMKLQVLFFCLVSISAGLATAVRCSDRGHFQPNGTYDRIREYALRSLVTNVTDAGGFFNITVAEDSDRLYALALCGQGSDKEACFNCVKDAAQMLAKECPNQTEAFFWGGNAPCLVRYSNWSAFGSLQLEPIETVINRGDISMDLTQFYRIWEPLMRQTLARASSGSSKLKYYAIAKQELKYFQNIYVYMQCSPDLSPGDCNRCLGESIGLYQGCCHEKQGGFIARPSCVYRWDLYSYYNAFNNIPSQALPPDLSSIVTDKKGNGSISLKTAAAIVVPVAVAFLVALVIAAFAIFRRRRFCTEVETTEYAVAPSFRFDFGTVRAATGDFALSNKLGQGGFGTVYKGEFGDGKLVAAKRLSSDSGQGDLEFKNEVSLLAKLQHRYLVKLLGFCLETNERILVYEFVSNSSLDRLISDPVKRSTLTWDARYRILEGIARGLLYLHEDSGLRIIHRDLKASNILLDAEMNPKISDFGLARMFSVDQSRGETSKIVGTYGYMPPEYIMHGHFSVKSDAYSFGILVLEVVSGQKNISFQGTEESESLLTYAWRAWSGGKALDLLDPILRNRSSGQIMRCIHVGLLCVQENVERRPTMNSVVLWLTSESATLPAPSSPAFQFHGRGSEPDGSSSPLLGQVSTNNPITELDPR